FQSSIHHKPSNIIIIQHPFHRRSPPIPPAAEHGGCQTARIYQQMNTRSHTAKTIASQLSTGEFTTIETLNIPAGSRPSILKRPKVIPTLEKSKTGFSLQNIPKQISKETDIYPAASTAGDLIISRRKS